MPPFFGILSGVLFFGILSGVLAARLAPLA